MGVRKNFIYNSVLTLSQYIIGLITFPYISRVLGVSNIGIVSYVDKTINFFILFTTLGISVIGTREIAKYRNNAEKLNSVFSSLVTMITMFIFVVLIFYIIAVLTFPKLNVYKELFYIGSAKIVFSALLIEWFYRGIQNFRYITLRNITIKLIYICALIAFVRTKEDYKIYFILTTAVIAINAIINNFYARNFVKYSFKGITLKPYFKQSLFLGSYMILTAMYTTFNVMYLGWVTDTIQVGYYWAALTIYSVTLGFFHAFTGVMMPRMSSLLSQGNIAIFKQMISKSFAALFTICFPLIIGSVTLAPQIIRLFTGTEYEGAILPMQIIMPLILVVGIAQILAVQVLMPMQKDKLILTASAIGAGIGIISNLLLVKTFGCVGTAIVLLISETSVSLFYAFYMIKNNIIIFPWRQLIINLLYSIPYLFICYGTLLLFNRLIMILLFAGLASTLYFSLINIVILKNSEFIGIIKSIKEYIKF